MRRTVTTLVVATVLLAGFAGVAGGQSSEVCVNIATADEDSEGSPTTVFVEGPDGYFQYNRTTEASSPDACELEEDLDDVIYMDLPTGDYTITVRNEKSAVHERWGAYDATVEDVDEESFWLIRKAPYHTSVGFQSPRDSQRFEPGETADFEARVYNPERSYTRDVTTEVYVYPEGGNRPNEPTRTVSAVSISPGRHATVEGSVPMPDTEGEYVVDVEFVTSFYDGSLERPSDYVDLGTVTVEAFEPPRIDDSAPNEGSIEMGPDEQQSFAVSVSDPDSTPTVQWYVDGARTTTGTSYTVDAPDIGSGVHTVRAVASDDTTSTEDDSVEWTVDVADAPEITSVSPGNAEVVLGRTVTFSADTASTGHRYDWTIGGQSFTGNSVERTFSSTGEKTATVAVTNDRGVTTEQSFVVSVERAPPSVTDLSVSSSSVTVGESVTFLASADDPAGRETGFDYEWRIGDQTFEGSSVETTFTDAATYDVELTVTNDYGTTTTQTRTITVEAAPPSITEISVSPSSVTIGEQVTLSADALDPAGRGTGFAYRWEIGNRTFSGNSVEATFTAAGTYDVELTVTNDFGETANQTSTLAVEAAPPSITQLSVTPSSLTAGERLSLSATATDPAQRSTGFTYEWSIGDQTFEGATVETRLSTVETHDVVLTVTNEYGTTTTRRQSVTVTNDDPRLERLSPDPGPTPQAGTEQRFLVSVSDADAAPATVTWTADGQQVASQSVTADERRLAFTYRFIDPGTHTVEVTVEDGHGARTALDWTVVVQNRPPRIQSVGPPSAAFSRMSGTSQTFNVTATDPDGGPLRYRWYVDGAQQSTGLQYRHSFEEAGTHNVTVVAVDSYGSIARQRWSVAVRNFRAVPEIDTSAAITALRPENETKFIALSFRNPSVNNRTAHVELALSLPNGVTVSATRNVQSGSQPEYVGEATVRPGEQTSISVAITVEDESLAGEQIDIPYQVIYYPDGQRDSYRVVENATRTIRVVGEATDATRSEGGGATSAGESGGAGTGGEPTTGSGPGFTVGTVVLALWCWLWVGRR